jgi:hypothetical protein
MTRSRRRQPRSLARLHVEGLEARTLLTLSWPGLATPLVEAPDNDALGTAQNLGGLDGGRAEVVGQIGDGPYGAADVDWYQFELASPARVLLTTLGQPAGSSLASVLSVYNTNLFDFDDPYTPTFHRLLAQDDGGTHGGDARLELTLGAGIYYVAVSGSGNLFFHPEVPGSGLEGSTGPYGLLITASDPDLPASGLHVLATDPVPGALLASSPFRLRFSLDGAINPDNVLLGDTVQLWFNATGEFGNGQDQLVPLDSFHFATAINELQLAPSAPLGPGAYRVLLGSTVLEGSPDYAMTFVITGIEGGVGADDTPPGAHDLGDVTDQGMVQRSGAIGDDASDPIPFNGADVDMYHFHISGPGEFALVAEVYAARIGSPLDAALTLFRAGPNGLEFVASNADTRNTIAYLFSDPALFAGLTEGDYYLAVSAGPNMPDAFLPPGQDGIFDPNVSHSGYLGFSTGPYVLALLVQPTSGAPSVTSVTPAEGAVLDAPPTHLQVQFDRPVNLWQLAFQAYELTGSRQLDAVYIEGEGGLRYFPRVESYDEASNTATFLLLDALPNGSYTLHFSGAEGLADFGGHPLLGNDPSGDYVVHFTVDGPLRGTEGNPTAWLDTEPNDDAGTPQLLGPLFPMEVAAGVTITRDFQGDPGSAPSDTEDNYQFALLQENCSYFLDFTALGALPQGTQLQLLDSEGNEVLALGPGEGAPPLVLPAGSYTLRVSGWGTADAAGVAYQITFVLQEAAYNPTPLVVGPGPAVRVRLVSNTTTPNVPPGPVGPLPSGNTVVTPAAPLPVRLPGAFSLPASSLLVQNVSPLQGVSAAGQGNGPSSGTQVVLGSTGLPAESLAFAILTNAVIAGDTLVHFLPEFVDEAIAPEVPGEGGMSPDDLRQLLDMFFGLWDVRGVEDAAAQGTPAAPETVPGEDEDSEDLVPDAPAADRSEPEAAAAPGWMWAALVAAALPLAAVRGRRTSASSLWPAGNGTDD